MELEFELVASPAAQNSVRCEIVVETIVRKVSHPGPAASS